MADGRSGDGLYGRPGTNCRLWVAESETVGSDVAIVAAILALLKFPFGTALGIYTLWVLAPAPPEWSMTRLRTEAESWFVSGPGYVPDLTH